MNCGGRVQSSAAGEDNFDTAATRQEDLQAQQASYEQDARDRRTAERPRRRSAAPILAIVLCVGLVTLCVLAWTMIRGGGSSKAGPSQPVIGTSGIGTSDSSSTSSQTGSGAVPPGVTTSAAGSATNPAATTGSVANPPQRQTSAAMVTAVPPAPAGAPTDYPAPSGGQAVISEPNAKQGGPQNFANNLVQRNQTFIGAHCWNQAPERRAAYLADRDQLLSAMANDPVAVGADGTQLG